MKRNIASEMLRVLKATGIILSYPLLPEQGDPPASQARALRAGLTSEPLNP